jgi:pseudouridine-5'-phosphate glycosidase
MIQYLPSLGFERSGLVVANPLSEEEQLDPELHERALRTSLEELERRGIRGGDVTPFLLNRFAAETKGESLRVNRLIILRNARLAARIAGALSALDGRS